MIRFCDKEVWTVDINDFENMSLYSFFLNNDRIDSIIVVYSDTKFEGIVTYGNLIHRNEYQQLIQNSKLYINQDIWTNARILFARDEYIKYIPVFNENEEIESFCFNDEKADPLLSEVEYLRNHPDYIFLEVLSDKLKALCIENFNELAYRIYQLAYARGIETFVLGEKWKYVGVENRIQDKYPDFEVLTIHAEGKTEYWKEENWSIIKEINGEFHDIHKIFILNCLAVSKLKANNVTVNKDNILYEKKELVSILCKKDNIKYLSGIMNYGYYAESYRTNFTDIYKLIHDMDTICNYFTLLKNIYKKKLVMVLGVCQLMEVTKYFKYSKQFMKEYMVLSITHISYIKRDLGIDYIPEEIYGLADVLICNKVNNTKAYPKRVATKHVLEYVKPECQVIVAPVLAFYGYFPQKRYFQTRLITDEYRSSGSIEAVQEKIKTDVIAKDYITENLEDSFRIMEILEADADIKISGFIRENYRKERLFHTFNHPSSRMIQALTERIYKKLGIDQKIIGLFFESDGLPHDTLIFPCVSRTLKLEFNIEEFHYRQEYFDTDTTLDKFIEFYVKEYLDNDDAMLLEKYI